MANSKQMNSKAIPIKIESNSLSLKTDLSSFSFGGIVQEKVSGKPVSGEFQSFGVTGVKADSKFANECSASGSYDSKGASVHIIPIVPSLGGFYGTDRLQTAMRKQFVDVVGNAYSSIEVSETDLIKLQMLEESGYLLVLATDRLLDLHNEQDRVNGLVSIPLYQAAGGRIQDKSAKMALINARNALAKVINDNFYLVGNERLDKLEYLVSRVFVGDTSRKTDFLIFIPKLYLDIMDDTSLTLGIDYGMYNAEDAFNAAMRIDAIYLDQVRARLEAFTKSAWFNEVSPFLYHIYGDDNAKLIKLNAYKEDGSFVFTLNDNITELIRNARYTGTIKSGTPGLWKNPIWEDPQGFIRQGGDPLDDEHTLPGMLVMPEAKVSYEDAHVYTNGTFVGTHSGAKEVFNFVDYPAADDVMLSVLASIFLSNPLDEGEFPQAGADAYAYGVITYTGPFLMLGHYINGYNGNTANTKLDVLGKFSPVKSTVMVFKLNDGSEPPALDVVVNSDYVYACEDSVGEINHIVFDVIEPNNSQFSTYLSYYHVTINDFDNLKKYDVHTYKLYTDVDNVVEFSKSTLEDLFKAYIYESSFISVPSTQRRK